jgi:hypothetical protein
MRGMMIPTGIDLDQRTKLWVKAVATATKLSSIVVRNDKRVYMKDSTTMNSSILST